jgi:hypothetical protein
MPLVIQYLIKLSISLAVVWGFYHLFLRRLTFYNWNRVFLLGYSLVAFFIPFINISPILEENELSSNKLVQAIPLVLTFARGDKDFSIGVWDWVLISFAGWLFLIDCSLDHPAPFVFEIKAVCKVASCCTG